MKKKNKLIITAIIYFCTIVYLTIRFLGFTQVRYEIPYSDLMRTTIPDDREGWYIDSSFPRLDSGLFVYSDNISLKPGVYRVTVRYTSTNDKCFSTVSADTNALFGLYVDEIPLKSTLNEISYSVYLFDSTDNFSVEIYYGGEGELIAKDVIVESTRGLIKLQFCLAVVLLIAITYLMFESNNERKKRLFILFTATIFSSMPLFIGAIRYGDDIGFHLMRIEGLKQELLKGNIPVKMQSIWQYGYGYPVSAYYGDLFLVIPAALRIMGFSVQASYNIFLFIINFATIVITFVCLNKTTNDELLAYTGAFLYAVTPYRLSDLYYRSALGEVIALTFLPLVVYAMWKIFSCDENDKEYKRGWIPLTIGLSGLIQSHVLSCLLTGYVIIFVCILNIKKVFVKNRFLVLLKSAIYPLILNAWFLIPCLTSMNNFDIKKPYRNLSRIQQNGTDINHVFSFWGNGKECVESIGFALGIGIIIFLYLFFTKNNKLSKRTKFFSWLAIFMLFASSIYFPWNKLSDLLGSNAVFVNNIQFPSRFLGIASILAVFSVCFLIMDIRLERKYLYMLASLTLILTAISAEYTMYTGNEEGDVRKVYDIAKLGRTDYCMAEYIYYTEENETVEEFLQSKLQLNELKPNLVTFSENITISEYEKMDTTVNMTVQNIDSNSGFIELPLLFYEQYLASDTNGNILQTECGKNHVLRVIIPPEYNGNVNVKYVHQTMWKISYFISMVSLICFLIYLSRIYFYKKGEVSHDSIAQ